MSMSRRVQKSRSHMSHQCSHKTTRKSSPLHLRPQAAATLPAPAAVDSVASVWLVARRPPLSDCKVLYRWLARWLYTRIQWTPDYGIEYQGVYTDEAEARWAASGPGMFFMELPLNGSLPEEICQYGKHDFPLSEASAMYRNRRLPLMTLTRAQAEALGARIEETARNAEGLCAIKA